MHLASVDVGGRTVAIIGSGFSGTVVAIHLLRAAPPGLDRLYLVERVEGHVGGVAYRTQSASHTLNVPAGRMSAFEDDPDGFLRFVRRREPALTGGSFVPRREYGEYLAETLDDARRSSPLPLLRVAGEVVSVSESGDDLILGLADGRSFPAERVVLAIGNYPPSDPPVGDGSVFTSIRYARDPWAGDALELDRRDDVLLVGTGLTMCDAALALRDADQQGRTHAISRRGLLPQPHRLSAKPPPHLDRPATLDAWPASAVGLLRGLRREVRERAGENVDWREVVTSIRADTPASGNGSARRSAGGSCATRGRIGRPIATAPRPRRPTRSRNWSRRAGSSSSSGASRGSTRTMEASSPRSGGAERRRARPSGSAR